ncbi:MAG: ABC transporter permease [Anaerolineae bacterium]|nr:ABC transporter permease [Anaerolineae bacterium]
MSNYILKRISQIFLMAFFATIVIFALIHLAPGDPVAALSSPGMSEEDRLGIARKYGLDQPLYVQYVRWLGTTLQGDLGRSLLTNQPINELISTRFGNTLQLVALAMVLNIVVGIVTGVIAATRRGSIFDLSSMTLAILSFSIPPFFLGIILILVFAVGLKWLPAGGAGSFHHLILPAIALGLATAALTARMTRSAMLEVLGSDYIRSARAKGLSESRVLFRHGLKNAMIPVLTIIGQTTGALLAGAVITETVFAYPGMGFTLVKSLSERDYPVIQAALLVTSFLYLTINLLIDIAYLYADPRIRYG